MGQHGKYRPLVSAAAALGLGIAWPGAAMACRLALLLGLDISSSVDISEDRLQRQGLAAALAAPSVTHAVLAQREPVALAVFEWSGRYQQDLLLDWTMVQGREDLLRVSQAIAQSQRSYSVFPTAIGFALGYASGVMNRAPDCLFRTIDLSGDGINNDGFGPDRAYAHFPLDGVTVNGLAIGGHDPEVADYYARQVLRGPGAFLEVADGFADFERAMTRKLLREMGSRLTGERAE